MSQQNPIPRVDAESHYAKFRQGLASKLPVLESTNTEAVAWGSKVFQFSSGPVPVNWTNDREFNAYLIGSRNSAAPGPFYSPSEDLYASYKAYLASIDDEVAEDEKLASLRQTLHTHHLALSETRNSLSQAFQSWRRDNPQEDQRDPTSQHDCHSWGKSNNHESARKCHQAVTEAEKNFDETLDQIAARLKAAKNPLANALLNLKRHNAEYTREDGTVEIRPAVDFSVDLAEAVKNWDTKLSTEWDLEGIDVTHSRIENPWHVVSDSHPARLPCFNKETYNQKESREWSRDPSIKAVLKAKGLAIVEIERPWLDFSLLATPCQLKKNSAYTLDNFFGPGGSLATIPVALVVMYKPSLSVSANTSLYEATNQAWAQNKIESFSFLGTHFKLDSERKKFGTIVAQTANTTVFNIGEDDGLGTCSVVGVISKTFYNGLSNAPTPISLSSRFSASAATGVTTIERPFSHPKFNQVIISNQAYHKLLNMPVSARGNKIWTISLHLPNIGPEEALDTMSMEWESVEKHLAEMFLYLVTNGISPPDSATATKVLATHPFAGTALLETFSFAIKDLDANSSSSTINPSSASVVAANIKHCILRAIPHWGEKDLDVSTRYSPLLSALLYENPSKAVETIKNKFIPAYDDGSKVISSPRPRRLAPFGTSSNGRVNSINGSKNSRSGTPRVPLPLNLQNAEPVSPGIQLATPRTGESPTPVAPSGILNNNNTLSGRSTPRNGSNLSATAGAFDEGPRNRAGINPRGGSGELMGPSSLINGRNDHSTDRKGGIIGTTFTGDTGKYSSSASLTLDSQGVTISATQADKGRAGRDSEHPVTKGSLLDGRVSLGKNGISGVALGVSLQDDSKVSRGRSTVEDRDEDYIARSGLGSQERGSEEDWDTKNSRSNGKILHLTRGLSSISKNGTAATNKPSIEEHDDAHGPEKATSEHEPCEKDCPPGEEDKDCNKKEKDCSPGKEQGGDCEGKERDCDSGKGMDGERHGKGYDSEEGEGDDHEETDRSSRKGHEEDYSEKEWSARKGLGEEFAGKDWNARNSRHGDYDARSMGSEDFHSNGRRIAIEGRKGSQPTSARGFRFSTKYIHDHHISEDRSSSRDGYYVGEAREVKGSLNGDYYSGDHEDATNGDYYTEIGTPTRYRS